MIDMIDTIVQADALAFMRSFESASIDAVITDPPYCAGAFSEAGRRNATHQGVRSDGAMRDGWFEGDNMGTAGLVWLLRELACEAHRVLVDGGAFVAFTDWRQVPNIAPALESSGLRWSAQVVWDKGSMGLGQGFRHRYELALVFTRGVGKWHAADVPDLIRCPRVKTADRRHPAQKPIGLLAPIIRACSPPGGLVVDPFCGSGSTFVACQHEGRRFAGCDRSAEIVELARAAVTGQVGLFASEEEA